MPTSDTEFQAVQLAALLHDVGKLYQRSGLHPSASYDSFTPGDYGAHGAHSKWSADFVERYVTPRWAAAQPFDVLTHHRSIPPSRIARLVALADRMAAGEREEEEGSGERPAWESQLLSVFSRLAVQGQATPTPGYHNLAPLELDRDAIFPREQRASRDECSRGYRLLWDGFQSDFARLEQTDFEAYLEAAYHLLYRYAWSVPSAAYHQTPDVSLFDHCRLTCAIAACLYLDDLDDHQVEALLAWPPKDAARAEPLLLLVGGDLSGLQGFLYTLASKGAAKTLRGRSFYLQLLVESAARYLLRGVGLPGTNALYWGGGRFYLLVPLSAEAALERAITELEQVMLDSHQGELSLATGHIALAAKDFERESFGRKWGEVGLKIADSKNRRFGRVMAQSYSALFAPSGVGGAGSRCQACHAEVPGGDPEASLCPACEGMLELGEEVAKASRDRSALISVAAQRPRTPGSWWQEALWRFGCWWEFGRGPEGALRYTLNQTDFVRAGAEGFRWIPSVVPRVVEGGLARTKEFGEIAADSLGLDRLAVLRMDVDDLGTLFATGLGASATASRVASLSSALRLFFEGWINRLCWEVEADRQMVPAEVGTRSGLLYGVYSGGDDLFVVGAWDRIPLLAQRIRADLASYSLNNPAVRISAGIAVVDSHQPVYQAAEESLEALERGSKEYRREDGRTKDAVTFLEETLGWEEFAAVRAQAADLAVLVGHGSEGGRVPKSLLGLLSKLYELYRREAKLQAGREGISDRRLYYGRWMWLATYGLSRARERARDEKAREALASLQKRLAQPEVIRRLGLTARWAEYLTRSREAENR